MKKRMLTILTFLLILTLPIYVYAANYIGNKNSYKFHYAKCHYVAKMNPKNKVYFNTRQEAINSGYVPCKVCKP